MTGVNQTPQENSEQDLQEQDEPTQEIGAVVYQCAQENQRAVAIKHAQQAVASDDCVVMPTDTVYGIAANAFSAAAVQRLLEAKGRNRTMPPPVLIAHSGVLDGLADQVSDEARALAQAFWPGGLTLICHSQPSLQWDLGETQGTVALRVPDDDVARELLTQTGPLAVSSANRTGLPAATTVEQAREMLQDKVSAYLDAGVRGKVSSSGSSAHPVLTRAPQASTIVDCTGTTPLVVRDGAITLAQLREVVPSVIGTGGGSETAAQNSESADPNSESADPNTASAARQTTEPAAEGRLHADGQGEPVDQGVGGSVGEGRGESGAAQNLAGASQVDGTDEHMEASRDSATTPAPSDPAAAHRGNDGTSTEGVDTSLEGGRTSKDRGSVEHSAVDHGAVDHGFGARAGVSGVSVDRRQAEVLVASGAGLAVSTTAEQTDATQAGPRTQHHPGPDQNRRRTGRSRVAGQPQPVDRFTAAALVARGSEDGYDSGPGASDQSRS